MNYSRTELAFLSEDAILILPEDRSVAWATIQDFVWKNSAQPYDFDIVESLVDKVIINHKARKIIIHVYHY